MKIFFQLPSFFKCMFLPSRCSVYLFIYFISEINLSSVRLLIYWGAFTDRFWMKQWELYLKRSNIGLFRYFQIALSYINDLYNAKESWNRRLNILQGSLTTWALRNQWNVYFNQSMRSFPFDFNFTHYRNDCVLNFINLYCLIYIFNSF